MFAGDVHSPAQAYSASLKRVCARYLEIPGDFRTLMDIDQKHEESRHWKRVDQAFQETVGQPPGEREAWVRRRYASDHDVRDAVLELLAVDESSAELFDRAMEDRDALAAEIADEEDVGVDLVGKRIGAYRLESLLATGGMGAVYRAERDDGEFRQTVAVKILPLWATGRQTISRLRAERQILSSLQHPGIAPLLDGGQTGDGFPYLVTAFIDGEPINRYVQDRSLDLDSILRVFAAVADAVDYAHGEGVVHRDLKPSNILVDKTGHPHLLDFGIAKIERGMLPELTVPRTMTGFVPMTPEYASPEQRRGDDVGMASDIYQLGLLLFELLTGTRAVSRGDAASQSPPLPSAAVRARIKPDPDLDRNALRRRSRELRGDLDTCMLKALREDPAERYESAGALADDLRRYLAGKPIGARREPFLSRLRRGIRGNPVPAILAAVLVVALAWTVAVRFLNGESEEVSSAVPAGADSVADSEAMRLYERGRALLDQRSAAGMSSSILHFERALDADPNLARAWTGIADALLMQLAYGHSDDPGDSERAELALQRALEIDPDLAEAWTALGTLEYQRRNAPKALEAYETAVERNPGYASAYTLAAYTLGLMGNAEAGIERAREGARLDPLAAEAFVNVTGAALSLGRFDEAFDSAQRAVEVSPGWPSTRFSLAMAQFYTADWGGALATLQGLNEPWLGAIVALFQLRAEFALGRTSDARARLTDIEASGDLYALAAAHAALGDLDRGYEILREIETWGDLPSLLFQGPDRHLWNPGAADPRFRTVRRQILDSWGVAGDD